MTTSKKLEWITKIMTVFNNSLLGASFILAGSIFPTGFLCSLGMYLYIGLILAYAQREQQNFSKTVLFWFPAMCFGKITDWIMK
jgi:hypothetical protein